MSMLVNHAKVGALPSSCTHDSTRRDGLLDHHCLLCGADGYWLAGRRLDEVHPAGHALINVKGLRS